MLGRIFEERVNKTKRSSEIQTYILRGFGFDVGKALQGDIVGFT
jgi:hypothetical protein